MEKFNFEIVAKSQGSKARAGILHTPHGDIKTPAFIPVGTKATVKALTPEEVKDTGAQAVLANTYHLYLQPGNEIIKKAGGLHNFMNWHGPVVTDSGGFQVFSLGVALGKGLSKVTKKNEEMMLSHEVDEDLETLKAKIDNSGVMFRSHIDGSAHYFTPEKSMEIQHDLGADIIFAFDECTSPLESKHYQIESLHRTHKWAEDSLKHHVEKGKYKIQALYGIVQGGRFEDLRKESAEAIKKIEVDGIGFAGFGIGGSFAKEDMSDAVRWVTDILPEEKPRHLLGIGEPDDMRKAIMEGIDTFDCVAPTRMARNGTLYGKDGERMNMLNAKYKDDFSLIDDSCECYTCKSYSKAYLSHLFRADEMLAGTLASIHNVNYLVKLVDDIREEIIRSR